MHLARTTLAIVIACVGSSFWPATPERVAPVGTEVYDWNAISFDVTTVTHQNAIIASHATSMMHIAIHDALNSIDRKYEPYIYEPRAEAGALPEAAIAAAAHVVLVDVIPTFPELDPKARAKAVEIVEEAYKKALAGVAEGRGKAQGIAVGEAAAKAVLLLRKDDKRSAVVDYKPGTEPTIQCPIHGPDMGDPENPAWPDQREWSNDFGKRIGKALGKIFKF